MKLRNKKTGAVANYTIILQRETGIDSNKAPVRYGCGTLAKLNEEWEDATDEEMQDKINSLEYQLSTVIDEMRLHGWIPGGLRFEKKKRG